MNAQKIQIIFNNLHEMRLAYSSLYGIKKGADMKIKRINTFFSRIHSCVYSFVCSRLTCHNVQYFVFYMNILLYVRRLYDIPSITLPNNTLLFLA